MGGTAILVVAVAALVVMAFAVGRLTRDRALTQGVQRGFEFLRQSSGRGIDVDKLLGGHLQAQHTRESLDAWVPERPDERISTNSHSGAAPSRPGGEHCGSQAKPAGDMACAIPPWSDVNEQLFADPRDHLVLRIDKLERSSYINLVIGIVASAIAFFILAVSAAWPVLAGTAGGLQQLAGYVPRLSIALLVEAVGFFFLRLYSRDSAAIRYFQNELTTLYYRKIAVFAALLSPSTTTSSLVAVFARMDRNRALREGETTVELELAHVDAESLAQNTATQLGPEGAGAKKRTRP